VVVDALGRWEHIPRRWRLGPVTETAVFADRDRLGLALDALLENAIAHTEPEDQIEVSARREDGHAVLAVADSGCGIEPGDLERMFHRLARADASHPREAGGFGLGLAIVQAITEAHRGSVRAHSTPGRGATFEIVLPLAPASVPMGESPSAPRPAPASSTP
jgi:signal transduction histidine kinase